MFMSYASDSSDPVASTEQTAAFTVDRSLNIILSDYFAWEGPVPPAAVKGWKQAMAWIEKQMRQTSMAPEEWCPKVAKTFEQKFLGSYKSLKKAAAYMGQSSDVVVLTPALLRSYSALVNQAVFNLVASKKALEMLEQRQTGMKMANLKNEGRQVLAAFQAAVIARGGKL